MDTHTKKLLGEFANKISEFEGSEQVIDFVLNGGCKNLHHFSEESDLDLIKDYCWTETEYTKELFDNFSTNNNLETNNEKVSENKTTSSDAMIFPHTRIIIFSNNEDYSLFCDKPIIIPFSYGENKLEKVNAFVSNKFNDYVFQLNAILEHRVDGHYIDFVYTVTTSEVEDFIAFNKMNILDTENSLKTAFNFIVNFVCWSNLSLNHSDSHALTESLSLLIDHSNNKTAGGVSYE